LDIKKLKKCDKCSGSGRRLDGKICDNCSGTGYISYTVKVDEQPETKKDN